MRVNFIGNVCNTNYVNAKFLRARGIDAHLFFRSDGDSQENPSAEDPHVRDALPHWCHPYTSAEVGQGWSPSPELLSRLSACDILHVQGLGVIMAAATGRPFVWHPHGGDVYGMPFHRYWWEQNAGDATMLTPAALMREAIVRADAIIIELWSHCWSRGLRLLDRFRMSDRIQSDIPLIIDVEKFSPGPKQSLSALLGYSPAGRLAGDLLLFHPTRQFLDPSAPVYYGNDILYRALGQLHRAGVRFTLVIVEKHNAEERVAKALIRELGIEHCVIWIPAMPRHRLIEWYRSADITITELFDGFGSAGTEAMACASPLLCNFLTESDDALFWTPKIAPPLINVKSEEDIVRAIEYYDRRREELQGVGARCRSWIEAHRAGDVVSGQLSRLYQEILNRGQVPRQPPLQVRDEESAPMNALKALEAALGALDAVGDAHREPGEGERALLAVTRQLAAERARSQHAQRSLKMLAQQAWRELSRRRGMTRAHGSARP